MGGCSPWSASKGARATRPPGSGASSGQTESSDGGAHLDRAPSDGIWGYPPTLLRLRDGRVLCSYGYRRPPYEIRTCFSRDEGKTWDVAQEAILRCDALAAGPGAGRGSTSDLGYPRSTATSPTARS